MMNARSLWDSIQGNPVFMRRVNGWLAFVWLAVGVGGVATSSVRESIPVLFFISVYANVSGHWSAWQAARVEVTQQAEAAEREREPVEEKVVAEIVERTSLDLEVGHEDT